MRNVEKLCIRCAFSYRNRRTGNSSYCCSKSKWVNIDLIDGTSGPVYCNVERIGGWIFSRMFNRCGEEGRFWERKSSG